MMKLKTDCIINSLNDNEYIKDFHFILVILRLGSFGFWVIKEFVNRLIICLVRNGEIMREHGHTMDETITARYENDVGGGRAMRLV